MLFPWKMVSLHKEHHPFVMQIFLKVTPNTTFFFSSSSGIYFNMYHHFGSIFSSGIRHWCIWQLLLPSLALLDFYHTFMIRQTVIQRWVIQKFVQMEFGFQCFCFIWIIYYVIWVWYFFSLELKVAGQYLHVTCNRDNGFEWNMKRISIQHFLSYCT